jgi:hypothetical protein
MLFFIWLTFMKLHVTNAASLFVSDTVHVRNWSTLIGQHFGPEPGVAEQVDEMGGLDRSCDRFYPQDPVAVIQVKICFVFPEGMVDLIDQPVGVIPVGHVGFEHFYHWNKTITNG